MEGSQAGIKPAVVFDMCVYIKRSAAIAPGEASPTDRPADRIGFFFAPINRRRL